MGDDPKRDDRRVSAAKRKAKYIVSSLVIRAAARADRDVAVEERSVRQERMIGAAREDIISVRARS